MRYVNGGQTNKETDMLIATPRTAAVGEGGEVMLPLLRRTHPEDVRLETAAGRRRRRRSVLPVTAVDEHHGRAIHIERKLQQTARATFISKQTHALHCQLDVFGQQRRRQDTYIHTYLKCYSAQYT